MYFDGAYYKEGSGVGILLISSDEVTYKFSFTLSFLCTNNIFFPSLDMHDNKKEIN